jgi:hypothetical protein
VAVFTSHEVKLPSVKRLEGAQETWRSNVVAAGGIAGLVRSPEEALALIRDGIR